MPIDRIWWGQRGKYLARGHEESTPLRSIRRSWPRAKYPSGPTTQTISTQYFDFVRHTFYQSWCNWTWKMKSFSLFFNKECQALVFASLKGLIFITRSITVQPKSLFFLTLSYLCVIMASLDLWTFHFLAGVTCMIEDKTTKKTRWLYFGLARRTL